jgi:RNA polymerase sigma-70 factor (ECF subfamily)
MISDKSLYSSFLEGDISSFEELVIRYRHSLVYFIMQYVKSYQIAEDIAQEVFAYIYINPERYSTDYLFKTFLFMLGKRRAIDFIRKESRIQSIQLDEADLMDTNSLDDIIFKRESISILREYINELKPQYRQVIILIDLNGLSLAETAKIMDKSVSAIKVLAHRAKKRLKKIMEKGGFSYEV